MKHKSYFSHVILLATLFLAEFYLPQQLTAQTHPNKERSVLLSGIVPLDLIQIRPGTFLMGQRPCEQDAYPNKETPQHAVTLSNGFWMGKYEVTKEQWQAVMGSAPWMGKQYVENDPESPAVYI